MIYHEPEIEQVPDWREGLTPEEIARLEEQGKKVTEYYNRPASELPPPDGNEHEDGLILKRIIEEKDKSD